MGRFFNTAGPCDPVLHYMVPPEPRLPEVRPLVERNLYAVLHAPRQSGKTTTLRALAQSMTASGRWAALHFSCQPAQAAGDDYGNTEDIILDTLAEDAEALPTELRPPLPWRQAPAGKRLTAGLRAWARACPRPLALFFDEIDAVRDASLVSVLSQLRAGYDKRPTDFPAAVVLCGLRDVRDYKAASGGDAGRLGSASPFNIKAESLRLGDFTFADVRALYAQHTAETGQSFTDEALARVWEYTRGQPWLVNALAAEIIDKIKVPLDERVTVDHIDQAKDRLIVARATHLDSLLARLHEERVRRVLEPLIVGDLPPADDTFGDDLSYARDLGLLAVNRPVRVANPIYREVILRVLATRTAEVVTAEPRSF